MNKNMNTWCTGRPLCQAGSGCLSRIRLLGCPVNSQACPVASTLISIQMHSGTASGHSVCFNALLSAENLIAPSECFCSSTIKLSLSSLSHLAVFSHHRFASNVPPSFVNTELFYKVSALIDPVIIHQLCFKLC